MDRYERNRQTITEQQQQRLAESRVAIAGCGGLGGYVVEQLARLGVGRLTVLDADAFDPSNLNRQLLSDVETIGARKAWAAAERVRRVNPEVTVRVLDARLTAENALEFVKDHDVVVDALDNLSTRLALQDACAQAGIPLVHGAIAGWYGQVAVVMPGARGLHALYAGSAERGLERRLGNPAFTPGAVASIQCAEVLKLLLGMDSPLRTQALRIDLLDHEYVLIPTE